jgi:hypothetical protein
MDMQLRIPVAGQVVQEQAGDQTGAVPPLPRLGGVVPGPGVGGMLAEPGHRRAGRFQRRLLQFVRAGVERGRLGIVAAVTGLPGGDPLGGVQHRDALGRADGQVEVRHLTGILASFQKGKSTGGAGGAIGPAAP